MSVEDDRPHASEWHRSFGDILLVEDRYYILASSSLAERSYVLKHDDMFALFDHFGDIKPVGLGEEGIYHEGTRYLSSLILRLGDSRPLFLSSGVGDDNSSLMVDLTNPDISVDGRVAISRGTLHIFRMKFLRDGVCHERMRLKNFGAERIRFSVSLHFDADFADIFEVRGLRRPRRGSLLEPRVSADRVELRYQGLDGVLRTSRIRFDPAPTDVRHHEATWDFALEPLGEAPIEITLAARDRSGPEEHLDFSAARDRASDEARRARASWCEIQSSNEQFNDWINRSVADVQMMVSKTPFGPYPYAGVPWFSTPFGRDGIITAFQTLWCAPSIARGVLSFLAATQAAEEDASSDAEPGKILHEMRQGEMAALREIPFGRYYGSIDSTPLFVMLAAGYYRRSGERGFIEQIWPNIRMAIDWIDRYGDIDGDGFVEYIRHSGEGLVQQGWKDSHDSVFHADGTQAAPPIALCEVQAYVYGARIGASQLAAALGDGQFARHLQRQAEELAARFSEAFWSEEIGSWALALDGEKRPCLVRSSNAGQCLFSGIGTMEQASSAAETLMGDELFSGWGIRTIGTGERRYNPMSYHNGSIWPHDNSLIADGFARYGLKEAALRVLTALFDASLFVNLHRLPELFCGFHRRAAAGPTLYPVACSPQAWASGAPLLLLRAALGMDIDAPTGRITLHHPQLPAWLDEVTLRELRIGDASLDLILERHPNDVGVNVARRDGAVEIVVVK